jgi:hypothetical protein
MGQLRILKSGWGVAGREPFKEGEVIDDEILPDGAVTQAVKGGKAERVAVTAPAAAKPAGGNS